ncbi:hypothetical protein [Roseiterribacter gracilis]|uniref:hypothetical protein n=1 Tax=Roseiterribacter gracilis TaxID=2812848 RepID=UPI003B42858B
MPSDNVITGLAQRARRWAYLVLIFCVTLLLLETLPFDLAFLLATGLLYQLGFIAKDFSLRTRLRSVQARLRAQLR